MEKESLSIDYLHHYEKALDSFTFLDQPEIAIKELEITIRLNPNFAQAYYDLGYIFNLLMMPVNAVKYYKAYLNLKPQAQDSTEVSNIISLLEYDQYCLA